MLHVASPFVLEEPRDENELIRPAVDGTLAVMRACKAAGVQRVSITSSVVSVYEMEPENEPEIFNESHWTDVNKRGLSAYAKSKVMAERAAWDFMEALPEGERFGLTTVNPAFVAGPSLIKTDFASAEVIRLFMKGKLPGGCPVIQIPVVDVREVAQAHLQCIKRDEA